MINGNERTESSITPLAAALALCDCACRAAESPGSADLADVRTMTVGDAARRGHIPSHTIRR